MAEHLIESARRIALESCREQGLDAHLTDPVVLRKIAAVIGSDAPDGVDPVRVEAVAATDGRVDDDVIEQRREDGPLAA